MAEISLTKTQRDLARHALGLTRKKTSYRNHFVTGEDSSDYPHWMDMVAQKAAWRRRGSSLSGGDDIFGMTHTGAVSVLERGEKLCAEDFPAKFGAA